MDMENKQKFRGPYLEPPILSILTPSGILCYSNQKDERVERENVLKKVKLFFSSPQWNEMSLYPPYHFPFCLLFQCLLRLIVSVALSLFLSLGPFKGLNQFRQFDVYFY